MTSTGTPDFFYFTQPDDFPEIAGVPPETKKLPFWGPRSVPEMKFNQMAYYSLLIKIIPYDHPSILTCDWYKPFI